MGTERKVGTVSRGIRCPIFREGDDLGSQVVASVLEAAEAEGFELRDRDVICITESVVARCQGNYATVDAIAALGYYNLSFQYNEEDNRLYINNNPLFTILTIGEKEITAVKMAGLQDDYQSLGKMKYVYHFVKLSRMTEMELQETRQRYYKDLSNWK